MKIEHVMLEFHSNESTVAGMINRARLRNEIRLALGRSRAVVLVGPRQSGKSAMAREFVAPDSDNYFDLEEPGSPAALAEPMAELEAAADLARSLGASEPTVRRYLDWLTQTFMIRQLQPWFEILASDRSNRRRFTFVIPGCCTRCWECVATVTCIVIHAPELPGRVLRSSRFYAWLGPTKHTSGQRTPGAELDLLMMKHGKRVGFEFKRMDAPRLTPSMRNAMSYLKLGALYVVYAGKPRYTLADRIEAVPLETLVAS